MGKIRLVPMTTPGIARKDFGPQHAKNILLKQKEAGRELWKILPNSGFTFDGNELKYNANKGKDKAGDE